MNPFTWLLKTVIRGYQRYISPLFPRRCRYYPTCSAYFLQALRRHGLVKGLLLGIWRLLRCNPWSLGGVDHVPDKGRWKPEPFPTYSQLVAMHEAQSENVSPRGSVNRQSVDDVTLSVEK